MTLFHNAALHGAAAAALLLAASLAHAQAAAGTRPDPSEPQARVPAALYASPLRSYQGYAETPLAPWRDSNELVRQRGGWKAYAREAREPAAAGAAAASAPAPAPHGVHHHGPK